MSSTATAVSRTVKDTVLAVEQAEGAGARVRRSIGTARLRNLSPFLMLDHFRVPKGAGFPDHPHRGQATITLMLEGKFQHEDFTGKSGIIGPGDLQWMQAGRGVVHSEMPLHDGDVVPIGLQLWVDLPTQNKFDEPDYQELLNHDIPVAHPTDDISIKVIAGAAQGSAAEGLVESPVRSKGGAAYYDIRLGRKGATVFQPIPKGWTAFVYTLTGEVSVGGSVPQPPYYTVVLTAGADEAGVELTSAADTETRLVLIAGEPLDQPVVQMGPFVLNSQQQVREAIMDYQLGRNGFERAPGWRSKIGASLMR